MQQYCKIKYKKKNKENYCTAKPASEINAIIIFFFAKFRVGITLRYEDRREVEGNS